MTAPFPAAQSLEPRSVSEAARQVEQLARERKRVAFLGGGTEVTAGAYPASVTTDIVQLSITARKLL